jgi:hypothetical protein
VLSVQLVLLNRDLVMFQGLFQLSKLLVTLASQGVVLGLLLVLSSVGGI